MHEFAPLKVALVGYGYWGPNLARNLEASEYTDLVAICDRDVSRSKMAAQKHRVDAYCGGLGELWRQHDDVEAVVIATPPETHAELAKVCLNLNKHVLVEKPMTTDSDDAVMLCELAAKKGLVLGVDHVYCHSTPARMIKRMIEEGELGKLLYINSTRINLGLFQSGCDVVQDLAVHDFSLIRYWFPDLVPSKIRAYGTRHYVDFHDTAHIHMTFLNLEAQAHIHVNWLSPLKVRQIIIAGEQKSIVWDDMNPVEPVKLYECGAVLNVPNQDTQRYWQMTYRRGDIYVPAMSGGETLMEVVENFAEAIRYQRMVRTSGEDGVAVVDMVSEACESIRSNSANAVYEKVSRQSS
jgi:predicted dehydrogenase